MSCVCSRLLAAARSPDSYIAGGVALHRDGPRYSGDIDIFQDTEQRLHDAAVADASTLTAAGLQLSWTKIVTGRRTAALEGLGDTMRLDWVHDAAFRFFPPQRDDLFGYVLHPADLATNKASAAADRREPRDLVDLITIHDTILPLGAVISAAVGRFPGQSPEEMLAEITRHSRFTAEEFQVLATERPLDPSDVHRRIRRMLEDAERFISRVPSDAVGLLFLKQGTPVQPDLEALGQYQRHTGSPGGIWPTSPEISAAMLERHVQDSRRPPIPGTRSTTPPTPVAPPSLTPPSEAVLRELAERERKRLQVIRTPTVRRFEERDQGMVQFGAVETIEGKHFALVHRQDELLVLSIDDTTYKELASVKRGHSLRVSSTGTLSLGKGHRR
jgi:hypothetical protein